MITDDKITEIFCATDEFSKKFDEEIENMPLLGSGGKSRRRRAASMSDSEIMTILIMFHFGTFDNFKHYYLHFIRVHLKRDFPDAVSYNRFVELESRVFFKMMFFLNLHSFGHSINDIDFCYFKNFFEECTTKRELLFVSRCVQLRHVLQEVLIVREYHVVERMVVSHEDACVNLVEVCSLVCVLAHAIFRGHKSSELCERKCYFLLNMPKATNFFFALGLNWE